MVQILLPAFATQMSNPGASQRFRKMRRHTLSLGQSRVVVVRAVLQAVVVGGLQARGVESAARLEALYMKGFERSALAEGAEGAELETSVVAMLETSASDPDVAGKLQASASESTAASVFLSDAMSSVMLERLLQLVSRALEHFRLDVFIVSVSVPMSSTVTTTASLTSTSRAFQRYGWARPLRNLA